jgi:hypothetical protein
MALTPGRWIAIFGVGACAITAAVIGLDETRMYRFFDYYVSEYSWTPGAARASSLANAVALLERRDSLTAAWRKSVARPGLELAFGSRVSAEQRRVLDSMARAFWRDRLQGPARMRTVLMITTDSSSSFRGIRIDISRRYILLPAQTDGRTCAVILPWDNGLVSRAATSYALQSSLRGVLEEFAGPCVWFAKYGFPGSAFGGWLSEKDYRPAFSVLERSSTAVLQVEQSHTTAGAVAAGAAGWFPRSIGLSAAACLAGRSAQCDSVWTERGFGTRSGWLPRGILQARGWGGEYGPTGVVSPHFVARLEAQLGPEKFARLWSSNASLESAFNDAAGASLTEMTRRMLLVDYGRLDATPWPTAFEWALDLGLIALSLGCLLLFTRRWRLASA